MTTVTRHVLEVAHPPAHVWALLTDPDRLAEFVPGARSVEVLTPGDAHGNGQVLRIGHDLALGRRGTTVEVTTDVARERGCTRRLLGTGPQGDRTSRLRIEPTGSGCRVVVEVSEVPRGRLGRLVDRVVRDRVDPVAPAGLAAADRWLTDHPGQTTHRAVSA